MVGGTWSVPKGNQGPRCGEEGRRHGPVGRVLAECGGAVALSDCAWCLPSSQAAPLSPLTSASCSLGPTCMDWTPCPLASGGRRVSLGVYSLVPPLGTSQAGSVLDSGGAGPPPEGPL